MKVQLQPLVKGAEFALHIPTLIFPPFHPTTLRPLNLLFLLHNGQNLVGFRCCSSGVAERSGEEWGWIASHRSALGVQLTLPRTKKIGLFAFHVSLFSRFPPAFLSLANFAVIGRFGSLESPVRLTPFKSDIQSTLFDAPPSAGSLRLRLIVPLSPPSLLLPAELRGEAALPSST